MVYIVLYHKKTFLEKNVKNIISELKKYNLLGRSGSCFPVALKWESVKNIRAKEKYIVCNASEGEPGVFKDGFILKNYPDEVVEGIKIALKTVKNSSAFIYLKKDYYERFKKRLQKSAKGFPIKIVKKKSVRYIAGEESSVCEAIEGKIPEPRIKPPFVSQVGLFSMPTLVNNVETFYWVAKIAKGQYKNHRFYSISGDVKNKGVFELPENWTIEKILKETKNFPKFDFFVKVGGGACGEILLPKELKKPASGAGAIIVFNRKKTNLISLMKGWAQFFNNGNCDKCTPCREGVYRMNEMLKKGKINKELLEDILFVLEKTSFCSLGKGIPETFKGVINKLIK